MDQSLGDEATEGQTPGERTPELRPGDRIEVYRVIRLLGRGGMGEVYEVEHEKLGTRHALKIIPSELARQRGFVERFEREARVMATLEHPGIVHVRDFRVTDGRYWLQMDLVKGVAVGERVPLGSGSRLEGGAPSPPRVPSASRAADDERQDGKRPTAERQTTGGDGAPPSKRPRADGDGAAPPRAVSLADLAAAHDGKLDQSLLADLLTQILEALAYAHAKGTVHRDLKPGNILLDEGCGDVNRKSERSEEAVHVPGTRRGQGNVPVSIRGETSRSVVARISDFGLVRLVGEEWVRSAAQRSTTVSTLGGAETLADDRSGASTKALLGTYEYMSPEQKSGGDVGPRSDLYAIGLTAYRLVTGQQVVGFKPPSHFDSTLAPGWDEVIGRAMEPDPENRFASAREMGEAVKGIAEAVASGEDHTPARPAEKRTQAVNGFCSHCRYWDWREAWQARVRGEAGRAFECPSCGKEVTVEPDGGDEAIPGSPKAISGPWACCVCGFVQEGTSWMVREVIHYANKVTIYDCRACERRTPLVWAGERSKDVAFPENDLYLKDVEIGKDWRNESFANSSKAILLVVGSCLAAEVYDRPCAYHLASIINSVGKGHDEQRAIVLTDQVYQHCEPLRVCPSIAVGGPLSNAWAEELQQAGDISYHTRTRRITVLRRDRTWAVWGEDAADGREAVTHFARETLGGLLAEAWQMTQQAACEQVDAQMRLDGRDPWPGNPYYATDLAALGGSLPCLDPEGKVLLLCSPILLAELCDRPLAYRLVRQIREMSPASDGVRALTCSSRRYAEDLWGLEAWKRPLILVGGEIAHGYGATGSPGAESLWCETAWAETFTEPRWVAEDARIVFGELPGGQAVCNLWGKHAANVLVAMRHFVASGLLVDFLREAGAWS